MNFCKRCHVPDIVSRDQVWNDDGTITIKTLPDIRMVLLEVPVLNALASKLEDMVGPSVKDLMTEGSRRGAYRYTMGLLKGPLKFVVRHMASGARIAYSKLMDTAWALGMGKIVMDSYEYRQRLSGRVYNGFNLPLLTGIVHGSFEAIEGFSAKSEWKERGNFAEVTIWIDKGSPSIDNAPSVLVLPREKASIARERCPACGLPKDVSLFKWHPERGDIEDDRTKVRMALIGLTDMDHVFHMLEGKAGGKVSSAIRAVNVEYGKEMVKKGWIKTLEELGTDLAAKGIGCVTVSSTAKGTVFSIKNHYHKEYVVGRCLGAHEALVGPGYTADVKEVGPASITLTLSRN